MTITLWGVRGSIPTPELNKMKTGGHTTCIEVSLNDGTIIIFDAGTGIIPLGKKLAKQFKRKIPPPIYMFLSHTHWDHLYGFPFFALNFIKGAKIDVFGPIKNHNSLEKVILTEMEFDYCPIRFTQLPSTINFIEIGEGRFEFIPNVILEVSKHLHPGGAYSYRLEADGKVFVYNTDIEHYPSQLDDRVIHISRDADFMIHDAQYTPKELEKHIGWGHSSWEQAVQVANLAHVKKLGFTHHHVDRTDKQIDALEKKAQKQFANSLFCREKMQITL